MRQCSGEWVASVGAQVDAAINDLCIVDSRCGAAARLLAPAPDGCCVGGCRRMDDNDAGAILPWLGCILAEPLFCQPLALRFAMLCQPLAERGIGRVSEEILCVAA